MKQLKSFNIVSFVASQLDSGGEKIVWGLWSYFFSLLCFPWRLTWPRCLFVSKRKKNAEAFTRALLNTQKLHVTRVKFNYNFESSKNNGRHKRQVPAMTGKMYAELEFLFLAEELEKGIKVTRVKHTARVTWKSALWYLKREQTRLIFCASKARLFLDPGMKTLTDLNPRVVNSRKRLNNANAEKVLS